MMTPDQPSRVTPAEISDLFDHFRRLPTDATLIDRMELWLEKAELLSGIAGKLRTPQAYGASADAWRQLGELIRLYAAEVSR